MDQKTGVGGNLLFPLNPFVLFELFLLSPVTCMTFLAKKEGNKSLEHISLQQGEGYPEAAPPKALEAVRPQPPNVL